jgi:DNA replication protein DnaC
MKTLPLKTRLEELKLTYFRDHCEELAKRAADESMPYLDYLQALVRGESAERFNRLVARRIRQARMPVIKSLDQFCWDHPRKINRAQVQALFGLDFITEKSNVVFMGGVGVGKTHLMLALANTACAAGVSVLFATAAGIVNALTAAQIAGTLVRELRKYTRPHLLCIDELGFVPLDKTAADLFFQVVSERYERGSIVVTTNRPYKSWVKTFNNDSVFTSALLDRLLHHSQTVLIEGSSYRMRKVQDQR